MIPLLLDLVPSAGGSPPAEPAKAAGAAGAALFRSTLAAVSPPAAAPRPAVRTLPNDLASVQKKIAKMLAAGASQSDVIATLAASLADSVAQTLGPTGAAQATALQAVFTKALGPPQADGSAADQARILAQRFAGIAATAQAIAGETIGQQKRFAGTFLDAQLAKELPAPTTATDLLASPASAVASAGTPPMMLPLPQHAAAQRSAVAAPAPPSTAASTAPPPAANSTLASDAFRPAQPAVSGVALGALPLSMTGADGKRVNLGSTAAIATGGDTLLGRTLARAALAAVARDSAIPAVPAKPAAAPAAAQPAAPAIAPAQPATTAAGALAAFVTSFENALHAAAAPAADHAAADDAAAPPVAAAAQTGGDAPPAQPAAAPAPIDRGTPSANVAPAAAPVDHSAIADQVLRGAFMRNVGQSSEMRLTLVPETLGDVNIKLVVSAGSVTAHLVAQTPEVRDALVSAQPQLARALADAGLKLSAFSVDVSANFAGFAQQQSGQPGNGQQPRRGLPIADTDSDDETLIEAVPTFGPAASAAPTPGDYNYLV
jgi:nicotinate-nucleotide--dimethylbenzimidazole phosphoribosyltransferase